MQKHHVLIGPNMAITRNIWNKVKSQLCENDNDAHEDIDLAIHIDQIGGTIHIDKSLIMNISARRMKENPLSFFVEYPLRTMQMLKQHTSL